MTQPLSEGGKFLAAALMKDVLHPMTGYDPGTDAVDADRGTPTRVRATDLSQGHGTEDTILTPEQRAQREFRKFIDNKLNGYA
ncbi:hypothetical protein AD006_12355 [Pseudonocardia sp. EC080610-09]|uniref:hypothetical protein n=1 Tax=unclassified Pseudonocardia TaxID=2619320 RepID=UPI0006CB3609|nr:MULTISPECIES: hypothetical protein [unclassified Pseudonocardia]ALE72584.1 hypothetical protein FRP1_04710 [Pseudonocardia sp. EC080625-04]ALL75898.1 hypothetical protein AD006_12355 [Pseudonocardia sp. EC080610-09]ALL82925.1 hypothetical protein AD017_20185 [Pseudonocardia sp. EC080619-01]